MTDKKLYLILQSVLCILLVVLLAGSAVSIFREGSAQKAENPMEWIFTPEKIAEKFKPIAPLFFGAVGLTVAGWILSVKDAHAEAPVRDVELARDLTVSRVAVPDEEMKKERLRQKRTLYGGWALFFLCMVPIGIYLAGSEHFPEGNLEEMIGSLSVHTIPWIILGLGCLMLSTVLQEKSMLRETAAAQLRIRSKKEAGVQPEPKAYPCGKNPKPKRRLQVIAVIAAVVFIILGICNGSAKAVHTKAANICTECVGLG
ncbi:MAG: hypothetical protein K6C12_12790 [Oscillospiraceae bacterium]|nr:hypothetical protein [Oscillospiraceae bacterium]